MGDPFRQIDIRIWIPALLWAAFVYGFHKYGAVVGWYVAYPWFQNLTHAASASGVAILVGLVGSALGYRGRGLAVFIIALTAVAAVGWELVEYLGWMDQYGVYLMFHGFDDAAVDMVSNAVGTTLTLTVLWWRTDLDPAGADRATVRT